MTRIEKQERKYTKGRKCTICKKTKPLTEFYIVKATGYHGKCIPCDKQFSTRETRKRRFQKLGESALRMEIGKLQALLKDHKDLLKDLFDESSNTK